MDDYSPAKNLMTMCFTYYYSGKVSLKVCVGATVLYKLAQRNHSKVLRTFKRKPELFDCKRKHMSYPPPLLAQRV